MYLVVALLAVTLAPPFGTASMRAISDLGESLVVDVEVSVVEHTDVVLVRVADLAGTTDVIALEPRGNRVWGTVMEIPTSAGLRVEFELAHPGGGSTTSAVSTPVQLGVDSELFRTGTSDRGLVVLERNERVDRSGWLAVAASAGLAALVALAVWTRGGNREGGGVDD